MFEKELIGDGVLKNKVCFGAWQFPKLFLIDEKSL
jgi:hypothetical protein